MPTVLRAGGFHFFFFSNEGNEPPHIHVEHAGCYAKFWLAPVRLAYSSRFWHRERAILRRIVERNQELFMEKWNEFLSGKDQTFCYRCPDYSKGTPRLARRWPRDLGAAPMVSPIAKGDQVTTSQLASDWAWNRH